MTCTFDSKNRFFFLLAATIGLICVNQLDGQENAYYAPQSGVFETLSSPSQSGVPPVYQPIQHQSLPPIVQSSQTAQPDATSEADAKKAVEAKEKAAEALKKRVASAHKLTFFDNDFSYLCDPNYCGWALGDRFKNLCLPRGGQFSAGGQFRFRGQSETNMRGLGLTGRDDQFLLYRTRIYGDWRMNQDLRVYAEMIDAESSEENFPPRPIEVNRADMLNLFVEARLFTGPRGGEWSTRIGTQELVFGEERLVSNLDWANTRRTFQGIRMMMKNKNMSLDGFWTNPMRVDEHSFDSPDRDQEFMGIYSSYKGFKNQTLDTYFLRYLNGRGRNDFKNNTVGVRSKGSKGQKLWDFEGAYQFGDNTDGSTHAAGMVTAGLGRKYDSLCWKPTLWLYYDYASGDDSLGAGNGFDQLFPLAHKYLGFMDFFGRRNIEDANIQWSANPSKKLKLLAWYHYLFLATQSDSPYSVAMTPFNGGNAPGSTELGHEIDLIASYKVSARQNLLLGYSRFFSSTLR